MGALLGNETHHLGGQSAAVGVNVLRRVQAPANDRRPAGEAEKEWCARDDSAQPLHSGRRAPLVGYLAVAAISRLVVRVAAVRLCRRSRLLARRQAHARPVEAPR